MTSLVLKGFLLTIVLSYASGHILTELKSHFLWKTNFALISLLENPFAFVESAAPPEEGKKLKQKIKKGKELVEDLNASLEKIKKSLAEQTEVEKEVLDRIIEIKDEFMAMQVDATDLPKDLIEKFKEKTIESLKLIMESYGLHNIMQKAKAKAETEDEVIGVEPKAEVIETEPEPEVIDAEPENDNTVDSKAQMKFEKEL